MKIRGQGRRVSYVDRSIAAKDRTLYLDSPSPLQQK